MSFIGTEFPLAFDVTSERTLCDPYFCIYMPDRDITVLIHRDMVSRVTCLYGFT